MISMNCRLAFGLQWALGITGVSRGSALGTDLSANALVVTLPSAPRLHRGNRRGRDCSKRANGG